MTKRADDRPVHHYDTERHQVACGSRATDDHSTKHLHDVTCAECITVARKEEERVGAPTHASAGGGAP